MDRAVQFYESVFDIALQVQDLGVLKMAIFPHQKEYGCGAALVLNKTHYRPSADELLVYFTSATGDLDADCVRVENVGGKVLMLKKQISKEWGFMCLVQDSEGNRIALHAQKE